MSRPSAKLGHRDLRRMNAKLSEGSGGTFIGNSGDKLKKLDKKDVVVGKVPENVTKPEFRLWVKSVELQLESIYEWTQPELVLHKVKLSKVEIDAI